MTQTAHVAPAAAESRTLFGHPIGLYVLFFTEMWERFSFYSMRAFLVLYMFKAVQIPQKASNEIYGAYLGFVYAAPFIGGMLADRLLGQRRAILIGAVLMAVAQFSLAGHAWLLKSGMSVADLSILFFLGLGLLSTGNGFFKPNISSIVGSLYKQGDPRRDGAFTIFYMGINIGALMAGFTGQLAEEYGWHWGFLLAGIGMILSQVIFTWGAKLLDGKGLPPRTGALGQPGLAGIPNGMALAIGVAVFVPICAFLIARPTWVQGLAVYVAIPILGYIIWEATRGTREEGGRIISILILCTFSMLFFSVFELAGSALNLFTDQHVQRVVHLPFLQPFEVKASLLTASTNPFFIILLGFPFAKLWVWLNKKQMEPSSPLKFSLGILQLAAGFWVLYLGAAQAGETGKCNLFYLVLGFLLHTTGELCLSPVGLSTMTKLSPARLVSTIMGVWFLASALGNVLGGWIGGKTEQYGYDKVFFWIAVGTAGASVLLLLLTPLVKKMMHGVK